MKPVMNLTDIQYAVLASNADVRIASMRRASGKTTLAKALYAKEVAEGRSPIYIVPVIRHAESFIREFPTHRKQVVTDRFQIMGRRFGIAIVDEAADCDEELIATALRQCGRIALIGTPAMTPPDAPPHWFHNWFFAYAIAQLRGRSAAVFYAGDGDIQNPHMVESVRHMFTERYFQTQMMAWF